MDISVVASKILERPETKLVIKWLSDNPIKAKILKVFGAATCSLILRRFLYKFYYFYI